MRRNIQKPFRAAFTLIAALAAATATWGALHAGVPASKPPEPDGSRRPATISRELQFGLKVISSSLEAPVHVTYAPGDSTHLYVTEQQGRIRMVNGRGTKSTFLDIRDRVLAGGEQGLLSVAFHPDYATNRKLYVDFTDKHGDTNITRFTVNGGKADPSTALLLLKIDQPFSNHNGGQLQFGPDGLLYIGMGDGGGGGDPRGRAQDTDELLGKILRIDVDHAGHDKNYGIPSGNPYANGRGGRPEIFASGVRNPWRFSFDTRTGDMWIGDVGEHDWEELDVLPNGTGAGANLGWKRYEGTHVFARDAPLRSANRLVKPVLEYGHDQGVSVVGGYVYRGAAIPTLQGYYLYTDIASDKLRGLKLEHGRIADRRTFDVGLESTSSFGTDAHGELYVTTLNGVLAQLVPR